MSPYPDSSMLQLSGIQHYTLCPRQWALIHIDQYWEDNHLTTEGELLHKNVDNPFLRETNGTDILTLRGLRISSPILGLTGIADAVEIHPFPGAPSKKADLLESHLFTALPIEYKRGNRKVNDCDRVQVTAQAMILEEMWNINIHQGAVFYWQERHREYFDLTESLRDKVIIAAKEMQTLFERKTLPLPENETNCRSCSLYDRCLPKLAYRSADSYIKQSLQILSQPES